MLNITYAVGTQGHEQNRREVPCSLHDSQDVNKLSSMSNQNPCHGPNCPQHRTFHSMEDYSAGKRNSL